MSFVPSKIVLTGIIVAMPVRTTERGRRTRQTILEAAAKLFHFRGVAATSVDEILAKSRAGKSQFYHYWKTKDDLIRDVVRMHVEHWIEDDRLLGALDTWPGIQRWCDALMEMMVETRCSGGCPMGTLAAELADSCPAIRDELAGAFLRMQARLEKGLAAMKRRGELGSDADPVRLAAFFVAAVQGGLLVAKTCRSLDDLRSVLEHASAHLKSFAR